MEARKVSTGPLGAASNRRLQDRIVSYLRGGRIHPACILAMPSSSEKLLIAKGIAKQLLCKNRAQNPGCGTCLACQKVEKEIHPDLLIVRPEEDDGDGSIKIDKIREVCSQMELTPLESTLKICIIQDCHRMNTAAANALLKTLEEPGEGRYFWLLTSQVSSLLPTLLSRSLKFLGEPDETSSPYTPEAIKLAEESWAAFEKKKNIRELVSALNSKEAVQALVASLQKRWREAVVRFPDNPDSYAHLELFDESLQLESRLRSNANYGLMLESFLVKHYG
ncbi:MAG: hypothetical protein ABL994_22965, partial [Verrucomicrobiales bacterium]